ncbi:MAG: tripartite tricarboxylate transporter substrate binding protein [Rubrivivax sp.]|nr:tripartite tricarboxylate transporter substrate binding protein [Rubrivivax sp.]
MELIQEPAWPSGETAARPLKPAAISRRQALRGLAALGLGASMAGASAAVHADRFPSRPVTLWVPWAAGGSTDQSLRLIAELAGHHLGQKVVVENRAGAGGTLVMPVLQQAAPDGYTVAQMPQPVFRAPWTQRVTWDPIRDTTPILQISGVTFGVVVAPGSPFRSLDDLFAYARAQPGHLTISTNGVGTTPHVVLDQLFGARGLEYVHVPYKGTSEQMLAVASGQVMAGVNSNGFAPFVDGGQLRLLVTFGERRTRRWPSVPTLKELGLGIVAQSPYGLAGPAGMAPETVRILHEAFKAAIHDPQHLAELARHDQELAYLGPEDYGRSMRSIHAAERLTVERLGLARRGP